MTVIALLQLDPTVGDIVGNVALVEAAVAKTSVRVASGLIHRARVQPEEVGAAAAPAPVGRMTTRSREAPWTPPLVVWTKRMSVCIAVTGGETTLHTVSLGRA